MLTNEPRTTEEAYSSAITTSDLRVEAEKRGAADLLIAAGWSESRIGALLLRLHTEYDSSARPRIMSASHFLPMAVGKNSGERSRHAAKMAHTHNLHETALHLQRMKSLPQAREQVAERGKQWLMENPEAIATGVIRWWLNQRCSTCNGTQWQLVPGTTRQSNKACDTCHATGKSPIPYGQDGRRLASWMDTCVDKARASIRRRLRPS